MDPQSAGPGQVWQEALTRIESQLSKPSFEAFLKAMRPVTLDQDVFVFSVPSVFAKEWLEGRYRGLIAETLREVLTRGVDVRFIVADGEPAATPPPRPAPRDSAAAPRPGAPTPRPWRSPNLPPGPTTRCSSTGASGSARHTCSRPSATTS